MDVRMKAGTETHCQLNTITKAFCSCTNPVNLSKEPKPNTFVCEVCLGFPGSKPVANKKMVDLAIKLALALNCGISKEIMFSRKTYFYNDQSKNYQITQYEFPLATSGYLTINTKGRKKKIRIRRLHMEEDPAKLIHRKQDSLVDYNRSGIPLVEIVTEPDFSSQEEPRMFLQKLALIMEYLGIYFKDSDASFKSDLNVSINGGERVELKNITGTKEIEKAMKHEVMRQTQSVEGGAKIVQETRGWSQEKGTSIHLRTKETEEDYGYIMDTDLVKITIPDEMIKRIKKELPEMPEQKLKRFIKDFKLNEKVAESIVTDIDLANLFENVSKTIKPSVSGSWISGYLKKSLNWHNLRYRDSGIKDEWILKVLKLFQQGKITDRNAELVLRKMINEKKDPDVIIKKYKLTVEDIKNIDAIVKAVISKNRKAVDDYTSGNEKAIHFLVGILVRETKGRIDANKAAELIKKMMKKCDV